MNPETIKALRAAGVTGDISTDALLRFARERGWHVKIEWPWTDGKCQIDLTEMEPPRKDIYHILTDGGPLPALAAAILAALAQDAPPAKLPDLQSLTQSELAEYAACRRKGTPPWQDIPPVSSETADPPAPIQPGVTYFVRQGAPATMASGYAVDWKAQTRTVQVSQRSAYGPPVWSCTPDNVPPSDQGGWWYHADDLSLTPWPDAPQPDAPAVQCDGWPCTPELCTASAMQAHDECSAQWRDAIRRALDEPLSDIRHNLEELIKPPDDSMYDATAEYVYAVGGLVRFMGRTATDEQRHAINLNWPIYADEHVGSLAEVQDRRGSKSGGVPVMFEGRTETFWFHPLDLAPAEPQPAQIEPSKQRTVYERGTAVLAEIERKSVTGHYRSWHECAYVEPGPDGKDQHFVEYKRRGYYCREGELLPIPYGRNNRQSRIAEAHFTGTGGQTHD